MRVKRLAASIAAAVLLAAPQAADDFQCENPDGCEAIIECGENKKDKCVVDFRNGDIISSHQGFLPTGDGWVDLGLLIDKSAWLGGTLNLYASGRVVWVPEPSSSPAPPPPPPCFLCEETDLGGGWVMYACSYTSADASSSCTVNLSGCSVTGTCTMGAAGQGGQFAALLRQLMVQLPGPEGFTPAPAGSGFLGLERKWIGNEIVAQWHPDPRVSSMDVLGGLEVPTGLAFDLVTGRAVVIAAKAGPGGGWEVTQGILPGTGAQPADTVPSLPRAPVQAQLAHDHP